MNRKSIAHLVRSSTVQNKKGEKCFICGTKKDIQQHHIIPVKTLSSIAYHHKYEYEDVVNMYKPCEFLCDGCHRLVHTLMEDSYDEPYIDYETIGKVVDLVSEIDLSNIDEEVYYDYSNEVDRMITSIKFNLAEFGDLSSEEIEYLFEDELNLEGNDIQEEGDLID